MGGRPKEWTEAATPTPPPPGSDRRSRSSRAPRAADPLPVAHAAGGGLELILELADPGARFNDACTDSAGRLWAATCDIANRAPLGKLYRIAPDLAAEAVLDGLDGLMRAALADSGLGALLSFDQHNVRYTTSTVIGEWARDKLIRYSLLTGNGDPYIWDFGSAAVHHRLYSPWLKPENCKAGLVGLRGTVHPDFGLMKRHAEEIAAIALYLASDEARWVTGIALPVDGGMSAGRT